MALISCRECGKQISDQAVACPNCGVPNRPGRTPDPVSVIAPKSRSMAILWAMLLGRHWHSLVLSRSAGMGYFILALLLDLHPCHRRFCSGTLFPQHVGRRISRRICRPSTFRLARPLTPKNPTDCCGRDIRKEDWEFQCSQPKVATGEERIFRTTGGAKF
jgi:hypothetical protein